MFLCDLFDIDMNRNPRNRGEQQGYQNQRAMRHTRKNPLYDDLFDTSAPSIKYKFYFMIKEIIFLINQYH